MKVAVIGTGIAGNYAAWKLSQEHDVTVFEADGRIGGHTNTVDVALGGETWAVDTGFIVFNDWTYPNFIEMLDELGVGWQDSDMSFSVKHERTGLEYNGTSLNALFAQRSNLFRPSFWGMIRDILRFHEQAPALLEAGAEDVPLGEWLEREGYGEAFVNHYVVPMGSAIWSATQERMRQMPVRFFVQFFKNHGMLSVNERPVWRVIRGGSREYVRKLVAGHRDRIHLNAPVTAIRRLPDGVQVTVRGQEPVRFDHVFVACHSDQALAMLQDPTPQEREVLGAIAYQENEAVLHTDASVLPRRRLAWAAWNYHLLEQPERPAAVTYNMNMLQGLDAPETFCVTLNHTDAIDPARIIDTYRYSHPVFTPEAVAAQARQREINQGNRTSFCGAYWRNGFHEDGVVSAINALEHFAEDSSHAQRDLQRTG
ncbi:MAG: FAD-dependent oxidoreductase [Xanthomonadales bacterium]|jgi:predicted NAD/FAD-binding protein|nr:FAD-dependent oxidoreductase [Xanthomonadales bacterium]